MACILVGQILIMCMEIFNAGIRHFCQGITILFSPDSIFNKSGQQADSIYDIRLINILQKPFYSISYFSVGKFRNLLASAETGIIRNSISKDEAVKIAAESFNAKPKLKAVEYITSTNGHHEYREKPLPAWAVTFDHPSKTTIYISAEIGRVESFRNNKWRVFDFLWMLHIMDYKGRDNLNNILLRIFSIVGLITVFSGFALFIVSSRLRKTSEF